MSFTIIRIEYNFLMQLTFLVFYIYLLKSIIKMSFIVINFEFKFSSNLFI
jgi:hypothetical protein